MLKKPNKERRKYPRIESIILTAFNYFDQKEYERRQGIARTLNISGNGILIESGCPFNLHSILEVTLSLGENHITLSGEVRRAEINETGHYLLGITFINTTPETQKYLLDFIS